MGQMNLRVNGEPLEEEDCFKYCWSQVTEGGGCEIKEVHRILLFVFYLFFSSFEWSILLIS